MTPKKFLERLKKRTSLDADEIVFSSLQISPNFPGLMLGLILCFMIITFLYSFSSNVVLSVLCVLAFISKLIYIFDSTMSTFTL